MMADSKLDPERQRMQQLHEGLVRWQRWGPYLSERQWGTVREDYSPHGTAWEYLPHDQARSRAYRWGEDGIAGMTDQHNRLCLALALWNGRDPILKERYFGLNNSEGNHGEDVKECYWYLDATPTHSYLKMLYKYSQQEYPYTWLVEENGRRGRDQREFELLDTGIFHEDRYFDVQLEYAKAGADDILLRLVIANRGPQAADLHVLPQLWFRNTWSWAPDAERPALSVGTHAAGNGAVGYRSIVTQHPTLERFELACGGSPELLFCDNDTNVRRLFGVQAGGYCKDAFHEYLVGGKTAAVNPRQTGTKSAAHYKLHVEAGGSATLRLRLSNATAVDPFAGFDALVELRRQEADAFYARLQARLEDADARQVQRQAWAGMLWSKQLYYYDVEQWLEGDPAEPPPPPERKTGRNSDWRHLNNADIISMPDKWEYPWYAAWDLAFHCIPLAQIDAEFAKQQLVLLLREWYMNALGQLPAYEWQFDDVNPPVHAWAAWRVFQLDRKQRGDSGDLDFLERVFHKLMLNFTWWVNRKDLHNRNIFQGGFLGLDNIGVFDRNAELPEGGYISQADGTSWMAMYALNLMRISLELALHNPVYEDVASKFFEHFLYIAAAINSADDQGTGLWDEQDGFYYDRLHMPDGRSTVLRVRSIVGLIPLFAVETIEPELLKRLPQFAGRMEWFLQHRPHLADLVSRWNEPGRGERRLLSLLRGHRMKKLLERMLDPGEFLSDYGVRSLSKFHQQHPYVFDCAGQRMSVDYEPAESTSAMFGGNSNWRGPIWFPINYLIIESLQKFHHYYGDDFLVECPTGSGQHATIDAVASELTRRLARIFLPGADGRRPLAGDCDKLATDPHFRDHVAFHEYFHGDTGRGLGAAHQTGWTGLIAKLLQPRHVH
ncbi:MAG TPA: glucosidase, partial [Pirellulales bacterium]|nr:glucosidase [Pirellulales bacterium]